MKNENVINIHIVHRFHVAPEQIFDAWLDPEMISKWMFGPALRDEEVLSINLKAEVGGKFSFGVLHQGEEADHVGQYLEISRPRRLIFTWGLRAQSSSQVMVEIVPLKDGVDLILNHDMPSGWANVENRVKRAWPKMFQSLEKLLA